MLNKHRVHFSPIREKWRNIHRVRREKEGKKEAHSLLARSRFLGAWFRCVPKVIP